MPTVRVMTHDEHLGFGTAHPVNRRKFAVATYRTKSRNPGWWVEVETNYAWDAQKLAQKYLNVFPADYVAIVVPDGFPDTKKLGVLQEEKA